MGEKPEQLTIRLFGVPEILVQGTPLPLHHQKARALLYYLAASGRPTTRDHLASLLWSEVVDGNARHSLRSSLYHIRQALHASGITSTLRVEGEQVSLNPSTTTCDVSTFRRLLAENSEETLLTASNLYHGPFLQGFTVTEAPLFEDWQRFEATTLKNEYLTMLRDLATRAEQGEAWQRAITCIQRIVQLEPLSEEMQQRLISLYLRVGEVGQALRQYRNFEAELRHELGITPSLETQTLITNILTKKHAPLTPLRLPLTVERTRHQAASLPLVGRNALLQDSFAISQEVSTGRGCTILIQGEDGAGRSRLLYELASLVAASQSPWLVLQGSCSPFDDLLSYGPFLEAFQHADLGDLSHLLAEEHQMDTGTQKRFLWSVLQALQTLSSGASVLLTIDDLQWANSPTLHLFGFLATRLRHLPVLLVGTVQRTSAIPALQRLTALGRRHGDVYQFSALPLTDEHIRDLISRLGIDADSDTWTATAFASWLYERSGGSPFVLGEMIAQLQAEQILFPYGNGQRLDVSRWRRWRATCTLPETVHDLVTWRLTNLSTQARRVLDVLAVAKLPLPFDLLANFPGVQNAELLATLEELETRGLVVESGRDLLMLPHHLIEETLLHPLSQLRRQTIHRQLASIMEQCPALQTHFPARQIALHAVAGEDRERARRYGLLVLDELVSENANAQTASFLQHLYDLLAPIATPRELLRLTSALGQVHRSLGQLEVAMNWYLLCREQAEKSTDPLTRATVHFEIGELALVANDFPTTAAEARAGLALDLSLENPRQTMLAARGHRLLGAALAMEGRDLSSAEHHLQEAVTVLRLLDTTGELCATLFELGNVAAQRGEIGQALDLYQEAAHRAEAAQAHYLFALAQNNFAYHSLIPGNLHEARDALASAQKVAERHELFGALMHLSSTRGEIHLYLGEWQAASVAFQDSLTLSEELANLERQAGNRAGLALAMRGQGHIDAALTAFAEALALLAERDFWHLKTRLQLWLAETHLVRENVNAAEHYLTEALSTARAHQRALLLLQAERLSAHALFLRGRTREADALFAQSITRAHNLHLPLEVARTQWTWGQALLHDIPYSPEAQRLLTEARHIFALHHAQAELHTFTNAVRG